MTLTEAYRAYIAQWSPPKGLRLHLCARGWTPLTQTQFAEECCVWGMSPKDMLKRLLLEEGRYPR